MSLTIEHITEIHWPAVASIYEQGIATGIATFETEVPSWADWKAAHLELGRYGAWHNNQLLGWIALSPVSKRHAYRGVAEVSVYIDQDFTRKGIGSKLIDRVIAESEKAGFWTLQSGIFPENLASINLHKKKGFRIIGYREKIAQRHGVWYDNVLMERRSNHFK